MNWHMHRQLRQRKLIQQQNLLLTTNNFFTGR
jgi:hypothetical protein